MINIRCNKCKKEEPQKYPHEIKLPDGWKSVAIYTGYARTDGDTVILGTYCGPCFNRLVEEYDFQPATGG